MNLPEIHVHFKEPKFIKNTVRPWDACFWGNWKTRAAQNCVSYKVSVTVTIGVNAKEEAKNPKLRDKAINVAKL